MKQMDVVIIEKSMEEIYDEENGRIPEKNMPRFRFVHHES
mgnify:CR=1 FL=1